MPLFGPRPDTFSWELHGGPDEPGVKGWRIAALVDGESIRFVFDQADGANSAADAVAMVHEATGGDAYVTMIEEISIKVSAVICPN